MIDPTVSLALSIYSNRGVYAVLLGSGVSRAASIPTGWEIVLDLIAKLAKLEGEDWAPDAAVWFEKKHDTVADYAKVLDFLAHTQTERQSLLKGYFEPTQDERSDNLKTPTAAHRNIAQLMAAGYVRIVLTTNFDRLMEMALDEVGIVPTVISTADQIAGALPLIHSGPTVIKLHGDYRDTRIRNTESELATYEQPLNDLLARVLDEYGLIICGWSAEWDVALRSAIERCPSRRFTTHWTTLSPLKSHAARLAAHRKAEVITIRTADDFFQNLSGKITALQDLGGSHPLSAKIAVATLKRYLVDPSFKIRLRDLVHEETERVCTVLNDTQFSGDSQETAAAEIKQRVARYEAACENLLPMIITGIYWGTGDQSKLWLKCLERIAGQQGIAQGLRYLVDLRKYPALLLLYGSGLAAIAAENFGALSLILKSAQAPPRPHDPLQPMCLAINAVSVMSTEHAYGLAGGPQQTPVSQYLFDKLREHLRNFLPEDANYMSTFDRFEYLLGLTYVHLTGDEWGPPGNFAWRNRRLDQKYLPTIMKQELQTAEKNWPPFKAGLFDGTAADTLRSMNMFEKYLKENFRH